MGPRSSRDNGRVGGEEGMTGRVEEGRVWEGKMGPRIREDMGAVGDPYDDEILHSASLRSE